MEEDSQEHGSHGRVFRTTVRDLAHDLRVKVAFVCEAVGAEDARTLALSVDGEFLENTTYKLAGTPCALVREKGVAFYAKDVAEIYPDDQVLADWEVDSYMGVSFFDSGGHPIGHVGVMNDRPLEDPGLVETRLRNAAQQLGEELERGR